MGIALDVSAFEADAQQQQAFAAGRIDIGFGSGPALSPNGAFDPASVAAVAASLKELGILDNVPDPKSLYTTRFVPVNL